MALRRSFRSRLGKPKTENWAGHGPDLGRDVHLENRRIFRVLMETHFRWSIFNGKTGFRLLSPRNDQRRRRHGPKDSISFFGKKSSLFHQKSIFQRDFTVTPYRPTAALRTPNNPPYTRDEPGTNCGRWGWRFASLRFPRPPPTTTAHLHLPYTCTYTLPGPGSECYPLTLNVAFSEANSSVLVHF